MTDNDTRERLAARIYGFVREGSTDRTYADSIEAIKEDYRYRADSILSIMAGRDDVAALLRVELAAAKAELANVLALKVTEKAEAALPSDKLDRECLVYGCIEGGTTREGTAPLCYKHHNAHPCACDENPRCIAFAEADKLLCSNCVVCCKTRPEHLHFVSDEDRNAWREYALEATPVIVGTIQATTAVCAYADRMLYEERKRIAMKIKNWM